MSGMVFWAVVAVLTSGLVAVLIGPFAGRGRGSARPLRSGEAALYVYRDQLRGLAAEAEAGFISAPEHEAARAEIERRMLGLADADEAPGPPTRAGPILAVVIGFVIVAGGLGLYANLGAPGLGGAPFTGRLPPSVVAPSADPDLLSLIGRLEAHLRENPEDPGGWRLLGQTYVGLGLYADAVAAYRQALDRQGNVGSGDARPVEGGRAALWSAYGEALVLAEGGQVTAFAADAFRSALALDPGDPRAGFFEGLGLAQNGQIDQALGRWRRLLAEAPAEAPWAAEVRARIERLVGPGGLDEGAGSGVTPEMIEEMVARLAARLAADPNDPEGWVRLVRAYSVLGQDAQAQAALDQARALFADRPDVLAALAEAAHRAP